MFVKPNYHWWVRHIVMVEYLTADNDTKVTKHIAHLLIRIRYEDKKVRECQGELLLFCSRFVLTVPHPFFKWNTTTTKTSPKTSTCSLYCYKPIRMCFTTLPTTINGFKTSHSTLFKWNYDTKYRNKKKVTYV